MYDFQTHVKHLDFPFFLEKNVEIPMYETFKNFAFFKFWRKNHHQNPHKYVFEFFLNTKSISRYYRNYRLFIRYSCYQSKQFTFFFVFSTDFPHSWRVEIWLFSIIFTIVQTPTPLLHSVAEKWSKSAKILPMGTSTKTRKTWLSIAKRQNGKTSGKNVPMGISTKIFKNLSDV